MRGDLGGWFECQGQGPEFLVLTLGARPGAKARGELVVGGLHALEGQSSAPYGEKPVWRAGLAALGFEAA